MICMVKDNVRGKVLPACEAKAEEGMEICTDDPEIRDYRKSALELLLSDHIGDCEAPCKNACPANLNIPEVNRLIKDGWFTKAAEIVRKDIALPLILGHICPAPCEKVCRRRQADSSIQICQLEKFSAFSQLADDQDVISPDLKKGQKIAVIGAGPAGLSCAYYLSVFGYKVLVYDSNPKAGGSLLSIDKEVLPERILDAEIQYLSRMGIEFELNKIVTGNLLKNSLLKDYDSVIISAGESAIDKDKLEELRSENTVYFCGSIDRSMNMAVKAVQSGKIAALKVDAFFKNIEFNFKRKFNSKFGNLFPSEIEEYLKESVSSERVIAVNGVLEGFNNDEARNEAGRCMHCDCRKKDDCKLRDRSEEYSVSQRRYGPSDRKILSKIFQTDQIVYESEKCIRCGLCVTICAEEKENTGLAFFGRGFDIRIDVPFSLSLNQALTSAGKKCVENCPTGALSFIKSSI